MVTQAVRAKMQGIVGIDPIIKKIDFDAKNIIIFLEDGRKLFAPLKYFPSIKKVPLSKRKQYNIVDSGKAINIFAADEVFHIRDFLGIPEEYLH